MKEERVETPDEPVLLISHQYNSRGEEKRRTIRWVDTKYRQIIRFKYNVHGNETQIDLDGDLIEYVVILRALFERPVKSQHKFVTSTFYTVSRISDVEVLGSSARAVARA